MPTQITSPEGVVTKVLRGTSDIRFSDLRTLLTSLGFENVEVIIDEWIETAIEKGWKIPEPKGRRLVYA